MASLNAIRVHRRGDTIFIPLPPELWRPALGDGPCSCNSCKGKSAYWDTLAVSAVPQERDFTWTPHVPEIQEHRVTKDELPVRFSVGQQFMTRHKHPRECIITDILRTYNSAGKLVKVRYVAEHKAANGQIVTDYDVPGTTVAMGLIK